MKASFSKNKLALNLLLAIYLAIAVFTLITVTVQTVFWVQRPFPGGFFDVNNNHIPVVNIFKHNKWALQDEKLAHGSILISVNGITLTKSTTLRDLLSSAEQGDIFVLGIQENGQIRDIEITLSHFTLAESIFYFFIPILASTACLLLGLWSFTDQLNRPISALETTLATSLSLIYVAFFDFFTVHHFNVILFVAMGMAVGSVLQMALSLPKERKWDKPSRGLTLIGFIPPMLLASYGIHQMTSPIAQGRHYLAIISYLIISSIISGIILGIVVFFDRIKGKSPLVTRHSENFIIALFVSLTPLTIQWIVNWINHTFPPINPLFLFPLIILPATVIQITRKFRTEKINKKAFRILLFILIIIFFGLAYTGIVYALNRVLLVNIQPDNPLIIGSLAVVVVLLLDPIRKEVNKLLKDDETTSDDHLKKAMEFATVFTSISTRRDALTLMGDATWDIINADRINIFLYDQAEGGFLEYSLPGANKVESPALPKEAPIPAILIESKSHLFLQAGLQETKNIEKKQAGFSSLYSHLNIPIWGNFGLLGWIEAISQKKNKPYTDEDIKLIKSLASQFALVLERIDTIASLQQRLLEMEILNKFALTVNSVSDLDQLLAASFDHIQQVIPIDSLSLILKQPDPLGHQRVFLYQDGQILISTTNPSTLGDEYPEKDGISTTSSFLVKHETEQWLLIPLIQDENHLGVLSLGKHSPHNDFNQMIMNLTEPIATLVTTAIIKSDLMDSLREKMHHLQRLNDVSQQLTSTLNMDLVFERIIDSALEILHAESGAILIANDAKDILIIRITRGAPWTHLVGRGIPVNQGIAGTAYAERHSIICNENILERIMKWDDIDPASLNVSNILSVPLIVQDEAFGILEVFNKENGLPFTNIDVEILEGFAAQAAIALNNASKYAKADQALEQRIDELTIMQKIDKDLHTSRELSTALQTTLSSALTYTKVQSGSIMLVDTYYHEIDDIWQRLPGSDQCKPYNLFELSAFPWFSDELEDPYQIIFEDPDALSDQLGLEGKYQAHLMITSKLDDDLYSLLILHLEDANTFKEQDLDFLLGLNNHAMIALRNAILYEDLNHAINAKNEFISFISHELKNPLTAIKGHADILAKGMVGDVNPEQEDFLKTISHNVRRMSTFITDLADQSQIESKSLRFVFDTSDVIDMINEVLQSYGQQLRGKSQKVIQNYPEDLPQVWCDRQRMIQILANLISNAIKYTPEEGTITISAEHTFNDWDPKGAAEVVHITVQDTGYGIDYEDQPHLFNKFFRGTNEKILKISGTGLGLRISKSLTEMMGGTMWFESTPGEGSTFHFTVPI
ncbi:GAF domain-containing protein [Chloroflexota bacterium]|nr:GAF domain-containing protein [Chloroflexota bacterium]